MDKVNVTDMSLRSCRRALDKFGSELLTASEKYAAALTECVSGVDSKLKNKLKIVKVNLIKRSLKTRLTTKRYILSKQMTSRRDLRLRKISGSKNCLMRASDRF